MEKAAFAGRSICLILGILWVLGPSSAQSARPHELLPPPGACTTSVKNSVNWGVATAAYQVEGAWNESGKSPSIWDTLTHTPGTIADNTTGDVTDDVYHRWRSDVALMKQLGIKNYRMSIAWTRIIPGGVSGSPVNMAGVDWYRTFIKALIDAGIKPAVTMYHWDLPQVLQDKYRGFMSPQIQRDFLYYAETLFKHLGDIVDQWLTFNEVISICELGYERSVFAPQLGGGVAAKYTCGHNILLAHAKTVKLYRDKYKAAQKGRLSIALDGKWGYPKNPKNKADVTAANNFVIFQYAWMADPIYFGDYPKVMRDTQGSDLPRFTAEESQLLRNTTIDFFSVNFYTGYYIWAPPKNAPKNQTWDAGLSFKSPGVPSNAAWLFKTPDGLRKLLKWLHKRYKGPEFWITENGVSGPGEEVKHVPEVLDDVFRQDYYKGYLDNLCLAKTKDSVNVKNYYAWSLLDNFEWRDGFSKRFGIVYIDLKNNLKRYPKGSAHWLANNFFKYGGPNSTGKARGNKKARAKAGGLKKAKPQGGTKAATPAKAKQLAQRKVAKSAKGKTNTHP